VEDFCKHILLVPEYISFFIISLTLCSTYQEQGRSAMPNRSSVYISVCVMTRLQLCITRFVSIYQYVHLFNCICACSFFSLCARICEHTLFLSFSPQEHPFSCVDTYKRSAFFIFILLFVCSIALAFECSCGHVSVQLCIDICSESCVFSRVCNSLALSVCFSVFSFRFPRLCCVQLPGFVHVCISLVLLSEGCFF